MEKIKATTDVAPEDFHDTVYQVVDGEKPKPKYVHAIKIYGDDDKEAVASGLVGLVHTRVLLDLDDHTREGTDSIHHPSDLVRPDIFPTLVRSPILWKASYETPMPELCETAWAMVEKNILNNATAGVGQQFKLETDANKVVNAVRVLLGGYFGGFVLLQLMGWIKKKLFARIHQLNPPHPVSVDSKLADIRVHGLKGVFDSRNFNRYYSGASVESNEFVPNKVLDALSRTFPHRPVALVAILFADGTKEHQPLFRHDFEMAEGVLVDDMVSVREVISLALSMNMDIADGAASVALEFCADKSVYTAKVTVTAGHVEVGDIECAQAGALSPHSMIEARKTLKDMMLSNFVNSIKSHGIFAHGKHSRSAILPFNVGKALVAHLNGTGLGFVFQTNSANDTGVEILMLEPAGEHHKLKGYITDKSIGAEDEIDHIAGPEKFSSLDTHAVLQGEEPVVVLSKNALMSIAASDKKDEYLGRFIKDSLATLRRVVYRSSAFGVHNILITTNPSTQTPEKERDVSVEFELPANFDPASLENFKSVGVGKFTSKNPSSVSFTMKQQRNAGAVRVVFSFKGEDVETATELLYTVLYASDTTGKE